jgi:hypothetical protein
MHRNLDEPHSSHVRLPFVILHDLYEPGLRHCVVDRVVHAEDQVLQGRIGFEVDETSKRTMGSAPTGESLRQYVWRRGRRGAGDRSFR